MNEWMNEWINERMKVYFLLSMITFINEKNRYTFKSKNTEQNMLCYYCLNIWASKSKTKIIGYRLHVIRYSHHLSMDGVDH